MIALKLSVTSGPPLAAQCVCCIPHPASGMDRVAGMVAQSGSKNISHQFQGELEREVWNSITADSWALLSNRWEQYCDKIQGNAFAFTARKFLISPCRHEKVSDIIHISRMAGHAAQQHVLWDVLKSVRWSVQ